jgi:deoxycytidylate deaminase
MAGFTGATIQVYRVGLTGLVVPMTEPMVPRPELVIALICPLGASVDLLEESIKSAFAPFKYSCEQIWLSDLLRNLESWTEEPNALEQTRIEYRQRCAAEFRRLGGPDALARAAIAAIRARRRTLTGDPDKPADSVAYILRQLKHPGEIELLRRVYGTSLTIIAGHAPHDTRVESLADLLARTAGKKSSTDRTIAETLITIDDREDSSDGDTDFGQNTRDAYPLADCFVELARGEGPSVGRFIELMFGHPFHTPTAEEVAMHQANAMALRSSDERRQVGAVIVKRTSREYMNSFADATVVASGMNEVPRRQGGYYWALESPDGRDQALRDSSQGVDREDIIKRDVLTEVAGRLKAQKWLADGFKDLEEYELADLLTKLLRRTQFSAISEFMRQVHAEMAAIVDAAMRGVPIRECEMYVTTFPCHGCAKHIIAAGIRKVVYLEPYPKSRAETLHREEIALDPKDPRAVGDKVLFLPFTGIAPRQFGRLFSMATRGRKKGPSLSEWPKRQSRLSPPHVFAHANAAYMRSERDELERLPKEYKWDRAALAPALSGFDPHR